jgi:transcriptional regulator with XRE-family HTH domain
VCGWKEAERMDNTPEDQNTTFESEFYRRVEMIKRRAKQAGTNLTQLCKTTGISRTTPERWEQRVPKSIKILDQMLEALLDAERAKEEQEQAFNDLPLREQQRLKVQEEERLKAQESARRENRNLKRRINRAVKKNSADKSAEND